MDARRAQFLIMVGEIGRQAALADMRVEITTRNDRVFHGIPDTYEAATDEVDDTGLAPEFRVDGELIALEEVVAVRVYAP